MSTSFLAYINLTDPLQEGWTLLEKRDRNHLLTTDKSGLIKVSPVPAPEAFTFDIVCVPHKLWFKREIITKVDPIFVEALDGQCMKFSHYEYWLSDVKTNKRFGKDFYFKWYNAVANAWKKVFKIQRNSNV